MAVSPEAVGDQPRGSVAPLTLASEPATIQLIPRDAELLSCRGVAKVRDVFAVEIIFAHGQGLQTADKPLSAFADRRHDIEREVESGVTFAIEASARQRGAFARDR